MKTLKFVTATVVAIGAAVIVGLYLVVLAAGTANQQVSNNYQACAPLYCQNIPTATTTVIAEEN